VGIRLSQLSTKLKLKLKLKLSLAIKDSETSIRLEFVTLSSRREGPLIDVICHSFRCHY